jgi:Tfp pilus assembly protein PilX
MVLIISLIMLLVITLIGISGVRGSVLGLHIASNEEQRMLAMQTAQAALDTISENIDNFSVGNESVGTVVKCLSHQSCLHNTLSLPGTSMAAVSSASITRIGPRTGTPPRLPGHEMSVKFDSVFFQIDVEASQVGDTQGYAKLSQGYMRINMTPVEAE